MIRVEDDVPHPLPEVGATRLTNQHHVGPSPFETVGEGGSNGGLPRAVATFQRQIAPHESLINEHTSRTVTGRCRSAYVDIARPFGVNSPRECLRVSSSSNPQPRPGPSPPTSAPMSSVESSMGHIRDLPRSAAEIPAKAKGEDWARLGVDVEHDFEPLYVVPKERKDRVKKLKEMLAGVDELYLATDEDREGESIAWHLTEVLKPKIPVHRMVFHEITKPAIEAAFANPRDLDQRLVDAQEARRILDRLYGYEVSPVLWRKIQQGLSAGRVQSVAVRIVVERERERMAFVPAGYWSIEGIFAPAVDLDRTFDATLFQVDEKRVASGKDFDSSGQAKEGVLTLDQEQATTLAEALLNRAFTVESVEQKPYKRSPYPPFRTSTLQQEAARKLRFSSSRTMSVAQRLYENGYITYMRTDSTALAESAVASARSQIAKLYGDEYLSPKPRVYASQVKGAQEAHEAIRPAGEVFRTPEQVGAEVGPDEARLYDLIWKRTRGLADGRCCRASPCRRSWPLPRRTPSKQSSAPVGAPSLSPDSCGPTCKAPTTPSPISTTARRSSLR